MADKLTIEYNCWTCKKKTQWTIYEQWDSSVFAKPKICIKGMKHIVQKCNECQSTFDKFERSE